MYCLGTWKNWCLFTVWGFFKKVYLLFGDFQKLIWGFEAPGTWHPLNFDHGYVFSCVYDSLRLEKALRRHRKRQ